MCTLCSRERTLSVKNNAATLEFGKRMYVEMFTDEGTGTIVGSTMRMRLSTSLSEVDNGKL